MKDAIAARLARVAPTWVAVAICVLLAVIFALGYRMLDQWRATAASLARRRADETVGLLATALLRDMRGVQESVLASSHLYDFVLQPPHDVRNQAGSAFARYPYPESFFSWRRGAAPAAMIFFNRGARPPAWMHGDTSTPRAPVVIESEARVAERLFARIRQDVDRRRRIAAFEMSLDGTPYQVVAQIVYRDPVGDDLEAIVGFTVNLAWVRRNYFPEITAQVARIADARGGASLAVLDDSGARVAGEAARSGPAIRRPFPLLFLDPLLVAADPPADLPIREWFAEVAVEGDTALTTAIRISNRALAIAAFATAALSVGLVLTVRAVRAGAELSEMRSQFVSTVTHEIKTPIASIRAIGDTIVSGRAAGPLLAECAQLLVQESKRLARLVDNLLAYSRITHATDAYFFESVDVATLVGDVLKGFSGQLREKAFEVDVAIAPALPAIRGDRTALRLALDNIVDNAIRYSGEVRRLTVRAEAAVGAVALEIADRGSGIPPEEVALVTRRFFRGRETEAAGSGLGLTIAHRIVADHGGTLTLDSEPGRGTTVRVTLPGARNGHAEENPGRRG